MTDKLLHVVPANEGAVDPHKVNVHDVVHELEELNLCPRGLRNELLHAVQRWHVRLFSTEITRDVADDLFAVAKLEKKRRVVVAKLNVTKTVKEPNATFKLWPSCRRFRL